MSPINESPRIQKLIDDLMAQKPCIEAERACLATEAYKANENLPLVLKKAKTLEHILANMTIVIRDNELIVGNQTTAPRSAPIFPEYSTKWIADEFERLPKRKGDSFDISDDTKDKLTEAFKYWDGKTVSELAMGYMSPETKLAQNHGVFGMGSYLFNGVGMICVDYEKVLRIGFNGIIKEAQQELESSDSNVPSFIKKRNFLQAVIVTSQAAINFAGRFASLAEKMASETTGTRSQELLRIAENCRNVPANPAKDFYEALQSFWFVQLIIQLESSGHSISPMRFDQYMYPYYIEDINIGKLNREGAQELLDCLWVKFNDINKVRDENTTRTFGGYPMFQNLCFGGQTKNGIDATNELSYACIEATIHVKLPQPSLSMRVWNGTPNELMIKAGECVRLGLGMPAFFNDEVIVPGLMNRGFSLEDSRNYGLIGCVELGIPGKAEGWCGAGFFNMVKPLELTMSNGCDGDVQVGLKTGELSSFDTFESFFNAYEKQMEYFVKLYCDGINCMDYAQLERGQVPFTSSMVDDCIGRGKTLQEGGAIYNMSGPQGVGVANVADSMEVIKELVFNQKKYTLEQIKDAMDNNFDGSDYESLLSDISHTSKYGNDIPEVDELARRAGTLYCRKIEKYKNPRGGFFHPGLYPVSANVPMGSETGATPDGRKAGLPLADGISPAPGRDVNGPTAITNSAAALDQVLATNGTLLNEKFHPTALRGQSGLEKLSSLVRGYFDKKGMHIQFNVIGRDTLLDAQKNPNNYKNLVVRVAGYSAHFTTLDKNIQNDIISRTELV